VPDGLPARYNEEEMTGLPDRATTDGARVLHPTGDVDAYTAPDLRADLHAATGSGAPVVVVDLSDVTFIDSAGLGALVGAHRRMLEAEGRLRLVRPPRLVARAFELTGLDTVLDFYDDRDAALAAPAPSRRPA
jgi:anti-anti-sigma factor